MSEKNNLVETNQNLTSVCDNESSFMNSSVQFLVDKENDLKESAYNDKLDNTKLDLIESVEPTSSAKIDLIGLKMTSTNSKEDSYSFNKLIQLSRNSSFSAKSHYTSNKSGTDKISITKKQPNQNSETVGLSCIRNASIADSGTAASIAGVAFTNPSINNSNTKLRNMNKNLFDTTSLDSTSSPGSIYSSLNNNNNNTNNANGENFYSSNNFNSMQVPTNISVKDPIVLRGAGNITIFGISNKFNEQFPSQLNAKLAPEEFRDTIKQINNILNKELSNSFRWLVFGSIFCCCTLGCSLLPVIFMNKKAKLSVNKLLEMENQRLYLKLGLKWRLTKIKYNSNSLLEYVLLIEFLPTILLWQPD